MPVAQGHSTPGTGPDLSGYPHLSYAPEQFGDHVGCHSTGTPVAEIVRAVAEAPAGTTTQKIADQFKVSIAEVMDALKYDADHRESKPPA